MIKTYAELTFNVILVSNTRISPGQQVVVDLGAKNQSTSNIDFVTAAIHQCVRWKAGSHSDSWVRNIASVTFRVTKEMRARNKDSMREIKQQQKQSGTTAKGPSNDVYREILDAVRDGANQVTLRIPSDTMMSYAGSLITINHQLIVKAKTPSCANDPQIPVPLQIMSGTSVIPEMAPAIPIANPEGWDSNNITTVPVVQASYAPVSYGGNEQTGDSVFNSTATAIPSAPPMPSQTQYTLPHLLEELSSCLSIKFKLEEMLIDPQWKSTISSLKPYEFDSILQKVTLDFDKVDVANIICPHIHDFTCVYAVAILRSVSNFLRVQFVQAMLPHICDLQENKRVLLTELSDWEKVCTERDFDNALT